MSIAVSISVRDDNIIGYSEDIWLLPVSSSLESEEKHMNFKEKYGEWGIILGATEGVGKATAEKIAENGMNVVLVGRREEALKELGASISEKYGVENMVIRADFSEDHAAAAIFEKTKDLDMGFMSYVACLHKFGKLQDTDWESHKRMLNVNINTFLECFYHYMGIFTKQKRGCVINYSSLTGVTSSPYNAQYGAGKAYIAKLTEAVAYESRDCVDVMVATLGSTITPSWLKNQPGGEAGEAAIKKAMTPEATIDEIFKQIGKVRSLVVGEVNRQAVRHWHCDISADEAAEYMGKFYE
ncbi:SDR family NAD(P)-dependent oxidoreductase [[Clostridium] innocuum]|nr:SDR family NAD(P)-dependent oxidoreductase [Erysipelotrichaceae bacterium]MCR0383683.1 SDR family NAD(P)-dependent oxidoreductase [[Clostridium] innocuum]MCR0415268.1 SDR family NAD(P)-dependent oxidoreductase [[Clostridium] innocuum]MDU1121465.1 SDR family NAD(P)-dependent oxidoreductase [Erysipelotrichaceae bacterium]